jgi:hypothetical protein
MKSQQLPRTCRLAGRSSMETMAAFLLALSFSVCGGSQAQGGGAKAVQIQRLGLHFDAGVHSFREDLLVPLGFNGPGISLGGVYSRQNGIRYFNVRLKLGFAYLKNRYSHEAGLAALELRPSLLWKVSHSDRNGEFWGGVCVPLQINSDLGLHSWDDSHLYWLTAYSLGLAAEWQKSITPKSLAVVRMETPLIGWVSRPPSYRYDKQDALTRFSFHFTEPNRSLHFETLDTYRALFMQILLKHEYPRSLLGLGLEFQYHYCNRPKNIYILNTSMIASYQWRIGR